MTSKVKILSLLIPSLALCIATLLTSCDRSVFYNENYRTDENGWAASEKLVFNINADDTTNNYLCCIDLRNSIDYSFSNIYFNIKTVFPDGAVAADTNLEFTLAQHDGKWLGKQNGKYVDGRYPFGYFRFPQTGTYQFIITHAMRDTILPGIKNVGMVITKL